MSMVEDWVPVTLGYLAARFLAGEKTVPDVLWRDATSDTSSSDVLSIHATLLAATTYGQPEGPIVTLPEAF